MEQYLKENCCCFTGHRPEKLANDPITVQRGLLKEIDAAIRDGITVFYSGMARGVDLWAAAIVLKRREKFPQIKLVCAIPYEGFENAWSEEWKRSYRSIRMLADDEIVFYPHFDYAAFQVRNEYMVDHSARVIAAYNGGKGGTQNTVLYAQAQGADLRFVAG